MWSHNTTIFGTIGFTPFKLLYGEEAMLPEEIKHQSLRVIKQALAEDKQYLKETIKGTRLEVVENITKYQKADQKLEGQSSCQENHTRRRLGPQKEIKCSECSKTPTKMERPLYCQGSWKNRVIPPN
jgi:hypothetical protein